MLKLTNLSFIIHTSSIKGEIQSWLFFGVLVATIKVVTDFANSDKDVAFICQYCVSS